MRDRRETIDRLVLNAGVMPREARPTRQGLELMFGVNYFANFWLVDRLLADGVIVNRSFAGLVPVSPPPRIVFVSSESHRGARYDVERLGEWVDYGMTDGIAVYGQSKAMLATYAAELCRRLAPRGEIEVAVHSTCPGAVNTGIAREAPLWSKPVLYPLMRLTFRRPELGAGPVVHLGCARELDHRTGVYLHYLTPKDPDPASLDPEAGRRLWEASEGLVARIRAEGV
jgi:NAD(P)-dependent dehydrogenase (short-subunit alcohol dehydrogenase family)